MLVDAKVQFESLKSTQFVTDEHECNEFSIFLTDLTMLMEKYASKVKELDVASVDLDDLKSRLALLRACTSCPVLNAKLDQSCSLIKGNISGGNQSLHANYGNFNLSHTILIQRGDQRWEE
jgi:hypothetical protein